MEPGPSMNRRPALRSVWSVLGADTQSDEFAHAIWEVWTDAPRPQYPEQLSAVRSRPSAGLSSGQELRQARHEAVGERSGLQGIEEGGLKEPRVRSDKRHARPGEQHRQQLCQKAAHLNGGARVPGPQRYPEHLPPLAEPDDQRMSGELDGR